MSFIQRELEKIEDLIRKGPNGDNHLLDCLRVAQQSLAWALDPDCFGSPSKHLAKFHGAQLIATHGTGIDHPFGHSPPPQFPNTVSGPPENPSVI